MPRVLTCPDAAYNAETGECVAAVYVESASWPAMPTVAQSVQIAEAVAMLWAIAWCSKTIGRAINSGKPTNHD